MRRSHRLNSAPIAPRPVRWGGLLALLCGGLGGCESTALSLLDPSQVTADFEPQYVTGSADEVTVTVVLRGVESPDDTTGEVTERQLLDYDLGDGLILNRSAFATNFIFDVVLTRFADAPQGPRTLSFQIRNHYGTFVATGEFYIFE